MSTNLWEEYFEKEIALFFKQFVRWRNSFTQLFSFSAAVSLKIALLKNSRAIKQIVSLLHEANVQKNVFHASTSTYS